jgi:hypothetical protein
LRGKFNRRQSLLKILGHYQASEDVGSNRLRDLGLLDFPQPVCDIPTRTASVVSEEKIGAVVLANQHT